MAQVVIDDQLMRRVRSLIEGETDEAIVTAALESWIVTKKNQIDLGQYQDKSYWDGEFVEVEAVDGRR